MCICGYNQFRFHPQKSSNAISRISAVCIERQTTNNNKTLHATTKAAQHNDELLDASNHLCNKWKAIVKTHSGERMFGWCRADRARKRRINCWPRAQRDPSARHHSKISRIRCAMHGTLVTTSFASFPKWAVSGLFPLFFLLHTNRFSSSCYIISRSDNHHWMSYTKATALMHICVYCVNHAIHLYMCTRIPPITIRHV